MTPMIPTRAGHIEACRAVDELTRLDSPERRKQRYREYRLQDRVNEVLGLVAAMFAERTHHPSGRWQLREEFACPTRTVAVMAADQLNHIDPAWGVHFEEDTQSNPPHWKIIIDLPPIPELPSAQR